MVTENVLKNTILAATFVLMFLPLIPPLDFAFFPFVSPKGFFLLFLSEIIFFLFLCYLIFFDKVKFKFSFLFFSLFLYILILTLSSIFGIDPSRSFWSKPERMSGLLVHFHLFLLFLVFSFFFKKEDFEKIFLVVALVAILVCFSFFATRNEEAFRGGGYLGNSSFLGTYLLFCFFICLWLVFESKNEMAKIFSGFSLFLILFSLLISDARAAKISVFFGLFLIACLFAIFSQKNKILKILVFLFLVSIFIVGLSFFLLLFKEGSFAQNLFAKIVGSRARIVVWEGAFKAFLERPILGYGIENFEVVFTKNFHPCLFTKECGGEIWFDRAHNFIFDQLINGGIFGFLSYLLVFLAAFFSLLKNYQKGEISFSTFSIFSSLFAAFLLQNLTVFDMPASLLMIFFTLGFVNHFSTKKPSFKKEKSKTSSQNFAPFLFPFLLVLFFVSLFYFVINPFQANLLFLKALKTQNPAEKLELFKKTLSLSPLGKYQYREHFFYNVLNQGASKEILSFLQQELEKSEMESPFDIKPKMFLANLKMAKGDLEGAEKELQKAKELSPNHQQVLWMLAQVKIQQNKKEEALDLLQKAVNLEKNYFKSWENLILTLKQFGQIEKAKQKIEEAEKLHPEWKKELEEILKES